MPSTSLVGEYDEVRRRVELLKQQHKEIVEARRAAEEVESIATLKFEEEKHALEEASRQKIRDLQRKLKESLDRSAKARDLHEREKRALLNKLDGVREALEEKRESDLAKKDEEIAAMAEKMNDFEEAMRHLEQLHQEDRLAWQREEEDAKRQVEDLIEEDKSKLTREAEQWKSQAESAERMLVEAAEKLKTHVQQMEQKDKLVANLQQTVEFMGAEREQENEAFEEKCQNYENLLSQSKEQYDQRLEEMQENFKSKLVQYKQRKNKDLDMLKQEFEKVMINKDNSISKLRSQLQQVNAHMQSLNQL